MTRCDRPYQIADAEGAEVVGQRKRVAPGELQSQHPAGGLRRGLWRFPPAVFSFGRLSPQVIKEAPAACQGAKFAALAFSLIVGGCLMALERVASEHSWLTWVALIPLFFSIRLLRPVGACLSGLLWGVSFFAFSTGALVSDVPGTWGAFVLLGVVPALYTFAAAMVTGRVGFNPFVLAFGWTGVELALAPLGLRDGLLAAPLANSVALTPLGHVLGFVLIAFLVAFVNALLVGLLGCIRPRIPGRGFAVGSALRETLSVPQTVMPAAGFPRFSLIPRAPPIAPLS